MSSEATMRVRFFEVGKPNGTAVYIERFPVRLALSEEGGILAEHDAALALCELEEVDGHLMFHCGEDEHDMAVNGAPLQEGPLLPGDKLQVRGRSYLVSYESAAAPVMSSRFRIQR